MEQINQNIHDKCNLPIRRPFGLDTHTHNLVIDCLKETHLSGGGGGTAWEFGISRCALSCREWTNNKVLL